MTVRHTNLPLAIRAVAVAISLFLAVVIDVSPAAALSAPSARGSAAREHVPNLLVDAGFDKFKIKPRDVGLVEAYGGDLILHWSSWTSRSAKGAGTAHPDHGHYPVRVLASRVFRGHFMRLRVDRKIHSHWRRELLFLDYRAPGELGWDPASWIENPASGLNFYGE